MTDMKRMTVSIPDNLVAALDMEKQKEQFSGRPYSAIIRHYLALGLGMNTADIRQGRPSKRAAQETQHGEVR